RRRSGALWRGGTNAEAVSRSRREGRLRAHRLGRCAAAPLGSAGGYPRHSGAIAPELPGKRAGAVRGSTSPFRFVAPPPVAASTPFGSWGLGPALAGTWRLPPPAIRWGSSNAETPRKLRPRR